MNSLSALFAVVCVLLSVNTFMARIVLPNTLQNEKLAEIYSDVTLECNISAKTLENIIWRKLKGV